MKILAIDTSTLTGSVALLEDGILKGEMTLSASVVHAERLLPTIDRLLQDAAQSLESVDLFAVAVGPGSFTGLRIAIATVQGFCLALKKSAMSISTLQALACHGGYFSGFVIPLLDARRGEVYAGIYRTQGAKPPQIVGEEMAIEPTKLIELLKEDRLSRLSLLFLGEGSLVYRDVINSGLKGRALFAPPHANQPRAAHVATLAWEQIQRGVACDQLMVPRYVRPAEVSFPIRRENVSQRLASRQ